jgi:hypothetical protein
VTSFGHPSRPGFYGISFSPELREQVALLCEAMIPGDGSYPSGREAQVPQFIEERSSAADKERLTALVARFPLTAQADAVAALAELEEVDPAFFAWLREFFYHGYYAARRVIAAMNDRGYDYHGAPQPLGYSLPGETARPARPRGSYIATSEVSRATS